MSEVDSKVTNGEKNGSEFEEQNKNDSLLEYSDSLKPYSLGSSLDFSPAGSVFESEDCDVSTFENDESGVESVDGDWLQLCNTPPSEYDLDLTEEQALETLKYFTLSLSRANQMTKTHQDLEAVLQLLQEKEKDLELAAHIGQSLLERNKNLYKKTEALENYVNEVEERVRNAANKESQLKHVVTMKDKLLKTFIDEDSDVEDYSPPEDSSAYDSCRDESMLSLQAKCSQLEESNTSLILEALKIRQETDREEEKEKELVYECIRELGDAKDQISHLTEEISMKAQDNFAQQEEISQLIETVLGLQERHNMLSEENEGLQESLKHSQENQNDLKVEVTTLHEKYQECYEMLMENQREMKMMKEKMGSQKSSEDEAVGILRPDPRDSLAHEIEESVRRDLETSQEKKKHTNRVMQTVRAANTTKQRFPKVIKGGQRPAKSAKAGQAKGAESKPFDFSFATTPPNEQGKQPPSLDDLRAAVRRLSVSDNVSQPRTRRGWAPEKLQIVKPMEGSATLHKWQSLAKPTMSGLHSVVPGVHVKGELARKDKVKDDSNPASTIKNDSTKEGKLVTKRRENTNDKPVKNTSSQTAKTGKQAKPSGNSQGEIKMEQVDTPSPDNSATQEDESTTTVTSSNPVKTTVNSTTSNIKIEQVDTPSPDNREITQKNESTTTVTRSNPLETTINSTSSNKTNLTEIVKSKLSAENVLSPSSEQSPILNTMLRSTVGVSSGLVSSTPVTTTAKSSFATMTTTATSSAMSISGFPRPLHRRSRSSENLLSLIAPFNQNVESTSTSAESLGPSSLQTGGIGFGGLVGRLVRSSSNENLAGSGELGFSRSASSTKLSDLLKNSDIAENIGKPSGKSSSVDMQKKRTSFHLGDSPPSASQLEMMGDLGGFALMSGGGGGNSSPPGNASPPAYEPTLPTASNTIFSAFSGIGGFFRRTRSKSLDNLGPLPASVTGPRPGPKAPVERSLERFDQVFGPG